MSKIEKPEPSETVKPLPVSRETADVTAVAAIDSTQIKKPAFSPTSAGDPTIKNK